MCSRRRSTSRQVGDDLRTNFQGNAAALLYAVVRGPATPDQVAQYAATVSRLPGVTSVQGAAGSWRSGAPTPAPSNRFVSGDVQYLIVAGPPDGSSAAAQTLVHDVRNIPPPGTSTVYLGGSPAQLVDSKSAIGSRLPYAILWIALTTLVLLFLFTGSVLLPVKALVLNALTMGAVFGVIVWVFQQGHLSSVFGFTPGPINTSMPVLLFCIAFGLSMDYEVFLLSRIKELRDHGASNDEAVAAGLARTGRIITTAAALLSVTFFAFLTSKVSFLQLFGLGTGLAIVIDATVIRGVLVPAVMTVARDANLVGASPATAHIPAVRTLRGTGRAGTPAGASGLTIQCRATSCRCHAAVFAGPTIRRRHRCRGSSRDNAANTGTGHSAGGQSLPLDSTVVDLSGMNAAVGVDGKGRTVRCQTGATPRQLVARTCPPAWSRARSRRCSASALNPTISPSSASCTRTCRPSCYPKP